MRTTFANTISNNANAAEIYLETGSTSHLSYEQEEYCMDILSDAKCEYDAIEEANLSESAKEQMRYSIVWECAEDMTATIKDCRDSEEE